MNNVLHRERLAKALEVLPIALQRLPGSSVTVGHTFKLHEATVRLLYPRTLPSVGRVADVERIVVTESSCHGLEFTL
jgi:hypothetical protein